MKKLKSVASGKIVALVLAFVWGVGLSGCGPAVVKSDSKHKFLENKIMECNPSGDYNIPQLKYNTEGSETMVLRMSGGVDRPTGIQFRDMNSGEMKKLFFGGKTYREYSCELLSTNK
jgi:hypothetical protein